MMSRLEGTLDYSQFGECDMVIEAVIENVGLKQQIFADLVGSLACLFRYFLLLLLLSSSLLLLLRLLEVYASW